MRIVLLGVVVIAVVAVMAGVTSAAEKAAVAVQARENQTTYMIHFGSGNGSDAVTPDLFDSFYEEVVAPHFPSGATIFHADGRWHDPKLSKMVTEKTFVVEVEGTAEAEADAVVDEIAGEYVRRFGRANTACFVKKYPDTSAKIHYPVKAAAAPVAAVRAECDVAMPAFVRHLETLVNMESGSDDFPQLNAKRDYLVDALEKAGASVAVFDAVGPRSGTSNIVARFPGSGKARIMLVAHYDTVWPIGEAAKRPFRIEDGVARGPGVSDEQHSIAGILVLPGILRALGYDDFAALTIVLNADEEKSSVGSKDLIMEEAAKHDAVFSLEGGGDDGDTVYVSCRGIAYATLTVEGAASHSGENPKAGRNAGVELARQMLRMLDLGDEEKGTDAHWTVGSFGIKANMIPGNAAATLNVRTKLNSEMDRVEAAMRERAADVFDRDCRVTVDFRRGRPPFEPNAATDLLAAKAQAIFSNELGRELQLLHMGGASDANFAYQAAPVLEGLGMGGGDWHALTEFLPLARVPDRLYLLVRMIQETCEGNTVPIGGPGKD